MNTIEKEYMMQVNLKKAAVLVEKLRMEIARSERVQFVVNINEFEDVDVAIANGRQKMFDAFVNAYSYYDALYGIRDKIAEKNAAFGVNSILNKIALVGKKLEVVEQYVNNIEGKPVDMVKAILVKVSEKDRSSAQQYNSVEYGSVNAGILYKADIDNFKSAKKDLEKQRTALQETLLEVNMTAKITLSDAELSVLTELNLV